MTTMTTTTKNFVEVTCACGALFLREVKRGRPQVWCPNCVAIPFYERVSAGATYVVKPKPVKSVKPVKVVAEVVTEVVPDTVPAPTSQYDPYVSHRDQIEADVAAVYVDHAARYAARIASGTAFLDAASATSAETREALKDVYAKYPKVKAKE